VSAVRVKKFCATTQFDATAAYSSGFKAPFTLAEGYRLLSLRRELSRTPAEVHRTLHYEFIDLEKDEVVFESE